MKANKIAVIDNKNNVDTMITKSHTESITGNKPCTDPKTYDKTHIESRMYDTPCTNPKMYKKPCAESKSYDDHQPLQTNYNS